MRLEVKSVISSDEKYEIHVSVTDQGIGMTSREAMNVFKEYWRSKNEVSRTLNYHGNGLGLFICRQICKGLGGNIKVKSAKGIGTTFDFYIIAHKTIPETDTVQRQRQHSSESSLLGFRRHDDD